VLASLRRPRTVVDVGVLVDGLLEPDGVSGRLLRHWLRHRSFELVMSDEILAELDRTLDDRTVRRRLEPEQARRLSAALGILATFVPSGGASTTVPEDPDDEVYLAAADAGRAPLIVTNDPHLLSLEAHPELEILTPRGFLDLLQVAS
jgi:putative PIN family toxin of toxin-antitoxin system